MAFPQHNPLKKKKKKIAWRTPWSRKISYSFCVFILCLCFLSVPKQKECFAKKLGIMAMYNMLDTAHSIGAKG